MLLYFGVSVAEQRQRCKACGRADSSPPPAVLFLQGKEVYPLATAAAG